MGKATRRWHPSPASAEGSPFPEPFFAMGLEMSAVGLARRAAGGKLRGLFCKAAKGARDE
jgi:hypothetical protein